MAAPVGKVAFATVAFVAILMFAATAAATYGAINHAVSIFKAYVVSPQWATSEGKIISSAILPRCGRAKGYELAVSYTYAVDQVKYQSSRVWFGSGYCGNQKKVEIMANNFPVGETLEVYFDPEIPSESVLIIGKSGDGTILAFLLLVSIPLAFIYLVIKIVIRAKRRRSKAIWIS